jgi:D-aminopeptidase
MRFSIAVALCLCCAVPVIAADSPRARDLGIPFDGAPGKWNAITDVAGVTVGHHTLIEDLAGGGAVRTGVTAVIPLGRDSLNNPVFGAWFALNGNGEMTGTTWLEESGRLEGPVMLTNTHSVGMVHHATIAWRVRQAGADATGYYWSLPVVAETWDGDLNDINGFHVKPEHVDAALESAASGPVAEGKVGGGTGMICHEFKGGIGTSSRMVKVLGATYGVGVLVQANHGAREELRIVGVPVGVHFPGEFEGRPEEDGSIIVVVATDAPLLPHQLKRLAKRAALGLARTGSVAHNGSGDILIAFTTADRGLGRNDRLLSHRSIPNDELDPLFTATVQATEESIVNALVAARDMTGHRGRTVRAIPHDRLIDVLRKYHRME